MIVCGELIAFDLSEGWIELDTGRGKYGIQRVHDRIMHLESDPESQDGTGVGSRWLHGLRTGDSLIAHVRGSTHMTLVSRPVVGIPRERLEN